MEIKIFLRTTNKDVVKAWSKDFNEIKNVYVSHGNIFDIQADAIISPANSFGFMDGGIDLLYSHFFGWDLQKRLQEDICKKYFGELPVGMATIVKTGNKNIKYLISCPTMRIPEIVSNTINAYLAFRAGLIEVVKFNAKNKKNKITSILCPGLGTGTGGIPPENCARQMKYAYDQIICNKNCFPDDLSEAIKEHDTLLAYLN